MWNKINFLWLETLCSFAYRFQLRHFVDIVLEYPLGSHIQGALVGGLLIHFVQVLLQILVLHTELLVKAIIVRVQVVPGIIRVAVIVTVVPVSPRGLIVLVIVVAVLYRLEE